jgi:two-component system cell cycle sensor histidine kinase/response regulator CckA
MLQAVLAGLVGLATCTAAISLLLAIGDRRDLSPRWHFLVSSGFVAFCLAQAIRNASPDPAVHDFAQRAIGAGASLFFLGVLEFCRHIARRPRSRIDVALGATLGVLAIYAALSPGGLHSTRIGEVVRWTTGWGEGLYRPLLTPEPAAAVYFVALYATLARTAYLGSVMWRLGARVDGSLTLGFSLGMALALSRSVAVLLGWLSGPQFTEVATLVVYLLSGLQLFRHQRQLSMEREGLLRDVQEREGMLSALLDHGLTLSCLLDPQGRVVLANRTALALAGLAPGQIRGRPLFDVPPWTSKSSAQRRLRAAISQAAGGEVDRFQIRHETPEGAAVDVDYSLAPYRQSTGEVRWLIAEGRDITALRQMEERLREGHRLEAIGQLAGGVAHDFNNMLTPILMNAELLKARPGLDPAVRRNATAIAQAADRAASLTRQLLAFARRARVETKTVDVHAVVEQALALFQRTAGPAFRIEKALGARERFVRADPAQLHSALLNLCLNGRDAMPAGGTLTVSTEEVELRPADAAHLTSAVEPGRYLALRVADTGTGIPPEVRHRIFEPFYTTKEPGKGTGLGLAAVLGTVHDHRGAIAVDSEPGKGTTFTLFFPVTDAIEPVAVHARGSGLRGEGLALVVDDEPLVRESTCRALATLGFESLTGNDGNEGLEILKKHGPSVRLVVADLAMPACDGLTMLRRLRPDHPSLPVVLCAGFHGGEAISELSTDPHLRFVPKPFGPQELAQALDELQLLLLPRE